MSNVSNLIQNLTEFIEVKSERIKLKLVSKTAMIFAIALSISMFIIIAFFMIFFLSFGLAHLINEVLRSPYWGFVILAGFYFITMVVVLILFKRKIIQGFFESLLIKLLEKEEDESED